MFYTYVLQSLKDGKYYIGYTTDIDARLKQHNAGMNRSTKLRRPLILVYHEEFGTSTLARQRENFLKRQKGGNGFKKIISGHPA